MDHQDSDTRIRIQDFSTEQSPSIEQLSIESCIFREIPDSTPMSGNNIFGVSGQSGPGPKQKTSVALFKKS